MTNEESPTIEKKRSRTMTPELLEKLARARAKAAQVMKERKELHSKTQSPPTPIQTEVDTVPIVVDTVPSEAHTVIERAPRVKKTKKSVVKKIQRIVEKESSDSDEDDEDDDDIVSDYLRKRYKHKYKTKYEAQVNHSLLKGQAANHIKNRVSEDMIRIASQSIFGGY